MVRVGGLTGASWSSFACRACAGDGGGVGELEVRGEDETKAEGA